MLYLTEWQNNCECWEKKYFFCSHRNYIYFFNVLKRSIVKNMFFLYSYILCQVNPSWALLEDDLSHLLQNNFLKVLFALILNKLNMQKAFFSILIWDDQSIIVILQKLILILEFFKSVCGTFFKYIFWKFFASLGKISEK